MTWHDRFVIFYHFDIFDIFDVDQFNIIYILDRHYIFYISYNFELFYNSDI